MDVSFLSKIFIFFIKLFSPSLFLRMFVINLSFTKSLFSNNIEEFVLFIFSVFSVCILSKTLFNLFETRYSVVAVLDSMEILTIYVDGCVQYTCDIFYFIENCSFKMLARFYRMQGSSSFPLEVAFLLLYLEYMPQIKLDGWIFLTHQLSSVYIEVHRLWIP